MCKKYGIRIAVFILLACFLIFGQDIRVENVFVPQDSVKKTGGNDWSGVLFYDLIYTGKSDTLFVWADFSPDSGKTWNEGLIWFSGEYGKTLPGQKKRIDWDILGSQGFENCFLRVFASDSLSSCGYTQPTIPKIIQYNRIYIGYDSTNNLYLYSIYLKIIKFPYDKIESCVVYFTYGEDTVITQKFETNLFNNDTLELNTDTFALNKSNRELTYDTLSYCFHIYVIDTCGNKSIEQIMCGGGIKFPPFDTWY